MQTPDLMPILSHGDHDSPAEGACIMEMASFLAGEEWSDKPQCVNPVLAGVAREVNDKLDDDERQQILPLLPRLMNSSADGCTVQLAAWCLARIPRSESSGVSIYHCVKAWAAYNSEEYGSAAEWAVTAYHLTPGRRGPDGLVAFLTGALDEYDRLTGRSTAAPLSPEQHRSLVELTTP